MKVAIIDDETGARKTLRIVLENYIKIPLTIEEFDGVDSAIKGISKIDFDIVFLDINLSDGNGFDVLDIIKERKFKVVFVTAYSEFAIKAFKYSAFEYLLKPISISDVQLVFEKLKDVQAITQLQETVFLEAKENQKISSVLLSSQHGFELIAFDDIVKLEASKSYCIFYLLNSTKKVSTKNLGYYEEILPKETFFRVHNSSIINSKHIKSYKNEGLLEMASNISQAVSKRKRSTFLILFEKIMNKRS